MPWSLAHALPPSVGAVPLTLILTVLLGAFLAANALGTRRAALTVGGQHVTVDERDAGIGTDSSTSAVGMAIGLALAVATLLLTLLGTPDPANNLTDTVMLQLGWGAIALSTMLVGPWWRRVNPVNAVSNGLSALAGGTGSTSLPRRAIVTLTSALMLGWAIAQLLMFITPVSFAIMLLVWLVAHAVITGLVGPRWLDVEPTNAMSDVLGLLRPGDGGPLRRLSTVTSSSRIGWVCSILIAWSLTDLILATEWWHDLALPSSTAFWVGFEILVGGALLLGWLVRASSRRAGLTPAMVPVAGGWVVSHYLSLLLIDGQGVPIWLSDPLNSGADLLGLSGAVINLEPLPIGVLTTMQLIPFLLGHMGGVIVAQRRAAALVGDPAKVGPATVEIRALIAVLLLGGTWLQLAGAVIGTDMTTVVALTPVVAMHPEDILPIAAVALLWVVLRRLFRGR